MTSIDFASLPLHAQTILALASHGIHIPTEVQNTAFAPIARGQDTVVQATVGTGKTLAYLLPLLAQLQTNVKARFCVFAPTPELAVQILRVVERFKPKDCLSVGLIGGAAMERQRDKLKKRPTFLVGTPGRILDFMRLKKVKPESLSAIVLDECDEMLQSGVGEQILDVLEHACRQTQKICVSATFGPGMRRMVHGVLRESCAFARGGAAPLSSDITHMAMHVDCNRKDVLLLQLVKKMAMQAALVFVNKRNHVPHLYKFLNEHGVSCEGLTAERGKSSRQQAMMAFRSHKVQVLVTTDAAARGIDISNLPWVVQYEPARDAETYLHRAGRTARSGRSGHCLTLVTREEVHLLRRYSKALNITFNLEPSLSSKMRFRPTAEARASL